MATIEKQEACQLYIEQEIEAGLADGKTKYAIGQEIAGWIERLFGAKVAPDTIRVRATRYEENLCTNVHSKHLEMTPARETIIKKYEAKETKREERRLTNEGLKKNSPPLPDGLYNVILSDPPWRYDFSETTTREIENKYPTMELEEIKNLPVPAAENSVLFLWATAPKLIEALEVLREWGFQYKTHAVWDKEIIGMGYWFRGQHELLLVGTRGSFSPPPPDLRISSVIRSRRTKHSEKPILVYDIIEKMFPDGKYLEMFSRVNRSGWVGWGNE